MAADKESALRTASVLKRTIETGPGFQLQITKMSAARNRGNALAVSTCGSTETRKNKRGSSYENQDIRQTLVINATLRGYA
jgi:hypothetical protein